MSSSRWSHGHGNCLRTNTGSMAWRQGWALCPRVRHDWTFVKGNLYCSLTTVPQGIFRGGLQTLLLGTLWDHVACPRLHKQAVLQCIGRLDLLAPGVPTYWATQTAFIFTIATEIFLGYSEKPSPKSLPGWCSYIHVISYHCREGVILFVGITACLLYTSPSPRD